MINFRRQAHGGEESSRNSYLNIPTPNPALGSHPFQLLPIPTLIITHPGVELPPHPEVVVRVAGGPVGAEEGAAFERGEVQVQRQRHAADGGMEGAREGGRL